MFKAGEMVKTKYGRATVVCMSNVQPRVYVRVHSRSNEIYVLNTADVTAMDFTPLERQSASEIIEQSGIDRRV